MKHFYVKDLETYVKGNQARDALRKTIRLIVRNAKAKNIDIYSIIKQPVDIVDENAMEHNYIITILKKDKDEITSIYINFEYKIEVYKKQAIIY